MEYETFKDLTVEQVEYQLAKDIEEHNRKIRKLILVGIILLLIIFRGTVSYWIKFGFPFPYKYESKQIELSLDPVQKNYTSAQKVKKTFTYKSLINKNMITIIPQAHYKLSGISIANNHDFLFRRGFFDSIALYDIGIAWGKMADKKFFKKYFKSYLQKNQISGRRVLWVEPKTYKVPIKMNYIKSHYSHSHIIPANNNIMGALIKIRDFDKVEIEGDLVDIVYTNKDGVAETYKTSTSRTDSGYNDGMGRGSDEIIYVTKVKLNHALYH